MRGLVNLLGSSVPNLGTHQRGLVILSCTNLPKKRILDSLQRWLPHIAWSILQREEFYPEGSYAEILTSLTSETAAQRFSFLMKLRKKEFDLCVIAWTGEPSYGLLKMIGLLSHARAFLVMNENGDGFILNRASRSTVWRHWRWRRRGGASHGTAHEILELLSWILLSPLGALYLILNTARLEFRKRWNRNR